MELSESDTAPIPNRNTPAYRGALAAVILLGVLIVIALAVLVVGLATRLGGHAGANAAPEAAQFTLAPGTRVVSVDVSGDRLVLRLKGPAGDEIDLIDTESGRLVAKIKSATPPAKK